MTTIEQLAEKMGLKLWEKGSVKRIYLNDVGYNTRQVTTKAFIFQHENGEYKVSVAVDCPTQPYEWVMSQEEILRKSIFRKIRQAISDDVYIMTDVTGNPVGGSGQVALNYAEFYYTEEEAEKALDNCLYFDKYITMPRNEFEAEVERLDAL